MKQQLAEKWIETRNNRDFNSLYKVVNPIVVNFCAKLNYTVCQEAASVAWIKAIDFINQYDKDKGNFTTWLCQIAKNESFRIQKRESIYCGSLGEGDDFSSRLEILVEKNRDYAEENEDPNYIDDMAERVMEKIKTLPADYRMILEDREVHKLSYKEIAAKRGMLQRTVSTKLRRGRIKIKEMFPNMKARFETDI